MAVNERDIMQRLRASREAPPAQETEANDAQEPQQPEVEARQSERRQQPDAAESVDTEAHAPETQDVVAEAPESVEGQPAQDSEPDDGITLETANDLAEHLGIPIDELYHLRWAFNDEAGERKETTLGEWKDGVAAAEMSKKRAAEYERMSGQLREEQTRYQQEAAQRLQTLQATIEAAEKHALAGLDDATLERMRADEDPNYGTYLAERMRREQALKSARESATAEANKLREEFGRKQQDAFVARQQQERERLLTLPEFRDWRDEKKYAEGAARLSAYAQSVGFTEQQLVGVDSKALQVLEKARRFDESRKNVTAARKQVVKVGAKVAKPGAAQTKARQADRSVDSARKRLKASGSIEDALGLLRARRTAR